MIPLRVHNVIDYIAAVGLVFVPALFGFSEILAARNVFLVLGAGLFGYSLITDYFYSLAKIIPVRIHMGLDIAAGVVLMMSPWVFGYINQIRGGDLAVHFIFGLGVIGLVTFTEKKRISKDTDSVETPTTRRVA